MKMMTKTCKCTYKKTQVAFPFLDCTSHRNGQASVLPLLAPSRLTHSLCRTPT